MMDNSLGSHKMYRKKIILFFLLISVSSMFCFPNLKISPSAQKVEEQQLKMTTITFNQEMKVSDPNYNRVSLEQIKEIANLDSVQSVEYHLGLELYSEKLKLPNELAKEGDKACSIVPITQFITNGVTHTQVAILKEDIMIFKEGRSFIEDELKKTTFEKVPVLISEEFATLNYLRLGSDFTLDNRVYVIH